MTTEEMLSAILKTSFVKADMLRRIRIVREYTEQRFFASEGKKELEDFLSKDDIADDDRKVIKGLGAEFFRSFTKENAYDLLEAVEAGVKELSTVNLYIPVQLDADGTRKLGTWVRENVDPSILIELHVDASVLGGCAFARDGKYHDFSLHHAFFTHKKEIGDVLERFIKKL